MLIIAGSVTSVASGSKESKELEASELLNNFAQTAFLVYAFSTAAVMLVMYIFVRRIAPLRDEMEGILFEAEEVS